MVICEVCGLDGGLLALSGPCFNCARARQRAAMDGRCHCRKGQRQARWVKVGPRRQALKCDRCFGVVR